jgi:NADH:ubiquinone oxidoreductase subunit 6 (subunit J)
MFTYFSPAKMTSTLAINMRATGRVRLATGVIALIVSVVAFPDLGGTASSGQRIWLLPVAALIVLVGFFGVLAFSLVVRRCLTLTRKSLITYANSGYALISSL